MNLKIITLISIIFLLASCTSDVWEQDAAVKNGDVYKRYHYPFILKIGKVYSTDVELFKDTRAWSLARAVYEQDTVTIVKLCKADQSLVSYQEQRIGRTLLLWAIQNDRYFSARKLLEMGADPNTKDSTGNSAFMFTADKQETANYLKLLLKYGGDPNTYVKLDSHTYFNILSNASINNIVSTKLLVEAGADINYSYNGLNSALSDALMLGTLETTEYLLKKGANYLRPFRALGDTVYPIDILRNNQERKLGTPEEQQIRDRIIKYIEEHSAEDSLKWLK